MVAYRVLSAGDTAIVVEFGDRIDRDISSLVLNFADRIDSAAVPGIVETVPTFRSLMIVFDPILLPEDTLEALVAQFLADVGSQGARGQHWRLPVCYDPSLAPDLAEVAELARLSPAQVVERHSSTTYHVYMLGFLPGFAYLGDVCPELQLPRRQVPRLKLPAGSVAIATTMSCVYPLECPGGWHVIGQCPIPMWSNASLRAFLSAGDKVSFEPISLRDFEVISADVANGRIQPREIEYRSVA